jgi:hypothetical protein
VYTVKGEPSSEEETARRLQTEMAGWKPRRGTDWVDLMTRAEETPLLRPTRGRLFVYSLSTAALVAILVLAAVALSTLDLGPLSSGGVNATWTGPR